MHIPSEMTTIISQNILPRYLTQMIAALTMKNNATSGINIVNIRAYTMHALNIDEEGTVYLDGCIHLMA